MPNDDVTKEQLLAEVAELQRRLEILQGGSSDRGLANMPPASLPDSLANREALLHEAQEVAQLGFYVLDVATGQWTASPLIFRIFGIPADYDREIENWRALLHPEDRDEVWQYFQESIRNKKPFDLEYRIVRPADRKVRWLHGLGRFQFDAAGQPISMLGTIQDVTDRKRAQILLQQAHDTLDRRVDERTAELLRVNRELARQHRYVLHLLRASDRERQLISYEIHDGLTQQLAGAMMQFEAFEHLRASEHDKATKAYAAGVAMLRQGHFEARRLIVGVRPPILDELGVLEAIAHLINELQLREGPAIRFRSHVAFNRLQTVLENAVYRICQEALTNACRHSQSKKVDVSLVQRDDRLRLKVRDWGVGFDLKSMRQNNFGLEGIRQRARLLGGKCRFQSSPGAGTTIIVHLPVVEVVGEAE